MRSMWLLIPFYKLPLFRRLLVVLIGITCLGVQPQSTAYSSTLDQNAKVPRFEERNCRYVFPIDWFEGVDEERFRCGFLVTWENYDTKTKTIWLSVMQTYPRGILPRSREPVIWLAGGPGAPGFGRTPAQTLDDTNNLGRGYIQFSQRGSYLSQTELKCPEIHDAIIGKWKEAAGQSPPGWEEWSLVQSNALVDCYKRLEQEHGADHLPIINSKFNALDVITLIQELRDENGQAILYTGSYGTLLAQHVLALSPKNIRSVVLIGVAPLGVDWAAEYPRNLRNSLQQIFDACNLSSKCQEVYPNLGHTFFVVLDQLKDEPICIPVKDGDDDLNVCLDDYDFLLTIGQMLYASENIKKIPRIIYGAWNRDLEQLTELGEHYYTEERDKDWPWGMYYSIYCSEFPGFDHDNIDLRQVEQEFQSIYSSSKQLLNKICPLYDLNGKSYGDIRVVNNKVPVLIFNGKYDPVTPMKYGNQVADALPVGEGFQFTSARGAHDSANSQCAGQIMKDFFHDPTRAPKSDCWKEETLPVEFELVDIGNPGSEPQEPQEPQVPISDIFNGWIQSIQDWWQQVRENANNPLDDLNKWWQELQEKIANAPEKFWEDLERRFTQWLEREFTEWLERTVTEWMNQCFSAALLPAGALATVWIARRRNGKRS